MTEGREPPPERGLFARIAVDIRPLQESRDFRRLWFGTGISAVGSQITTVAIPYQLYEETRSTLLVGMLGVAALVPLLIVPIYGGAVADAVDRRRLLLLSDVGLLLVTGGLLVNALLPEPKRRVPLRRPRRSAPRRTAFSARRATRSRRDSSGTTNCWRRSPWRT